MPAAASAPSPEEHCGTPVDHSLRRELAKLDIAGRLVVVAGLVRALVLAPASRAARAPALVGAATIKRGRALFLAKGCGGCHRLAGVGDEPQDLTGLWRQAGRRRA